MRNAIILWKGNNASVDKELEGAANRLEAILLDDDVPGMNWQPSKVQKVQLVCEDFAGNNFSLLGMVVYDLIDADYYASKLKLYCFIIADYRRVSCCSDFKKDLADGLLHLL